MDHRLEHLRGGDHRLPLVVGLADQPLLHEGYLLEGHFDAQIAARHHHGVRHGHDFLEIVERRRLFDLGDQLGRRIDELAQLFDVFRTPHEGEGQVVHANLHRVSYVFAILLGQRGRRNLDAGQVHALVRRQDAAVNHAPPHTRRLDRGHFNRQQPVVQQDPRADFGVVRQAFVGGGQLVAARPLLRSKDHLLPRPQLARRGEITDSDAGTLQVEQHRDRRAALFGHLAGGRNPFSTLLGSAVRGIDAQHVRPRL